MKSIDAQPEDKIEWRNALTIGASSLLVFHLVLKYGPSLVGAAWPESTGLDPTALALVVVALLPWIATYLTSAKLPGGIELQFQEVRRRQEMNERAISQLRFIVNGFLTQSEYKHLLHIRDNEEYDIGIIDARDDRLENELRRLLALNLIDYAVAYRGVGDFVARDNVKRRIGEWFKLTVHGEEYLKMRDETESLNLSRPPDK